MFERLTAVESCLDTLLAHRQNADLLALRDGLHHALLPVQPDYMGLRQAADWLADIAHLLDPDGKPDRSGTQVQQELTAFLSDIDQMTFCRLNSIVQSISRIARPLKLA